MQMIVMSDLKVEWLFSFLLIAFLNWFLQRKGTKCSYWEKNQIMQAKAMESNGLIMDFISSSFLIFLLF